MGGVDVVAAVLDHRARCGVAGYARVLYVDSQFESLRNGDADTARHLPAEQHVRTGLGACSGTCASGESAPQFLVVLRDVKVLHVHVSLSVPG